MHWIFCFGTHCISSVNVLLYMQLNWNINVAEINDQIKATMENGGDAECQEFHFDLFPTFQLISFYVLTIPILIPCTISKGK